MFMAMTKKLLTAQLEMNTHGEKLTHRLIAGKIVLQTHRPQVAYGFKEKN